jgi:hypothetical protein
MKTWIRTWIWTWAWTGTETYTKYANMYTCLCNWLEERRHYNMLLLQQRSDQNLKCIDWKIQVGKYGFKGIVSRDWDWPEWVVNKRSKELRIAGAYFYCFFMPFSCSIVKKLALSVSHLTVTRWMMSNNCRSVLSISFVHVWLILQ